MTSLRSLRSMTLSCLRETAPVLVRTSHSTVRTQIGFQMDSNSRLCRVRFTECGADELTCANEPRCVDSSQVCNYHTLCTQLTDETNCTTMTSYACAFEAYGACGLEQSADDSLDWEVIRARDRLGNRPNRDHTLDSQDGYFAYVSTMTSPGTSAQLLLPVNAPASISCLSFQLSMASKGILRVGEQYFYSGKYSIVIPSFPHP